MAGEAAKGKAVLDDVVRCYNATWSRVERPRDIPPLETNQIHLCTLDLACFDTADYQLLLGPRDYARGQRIADKDKRRLYLGGRFGLKILLWMYTGISPAKLRFEYGSRGKPRLMSDHPGQGIEFNYTLSRDKVLYAFSRAIPLGVDMEVLPRRINAAGMAATRLTREERHAWHGLPEHLKNDGMLCCWTRKEAYGKALGVGIRFRLGGVNLFSDLDHADWQTPRTALFDSTDTAAMPGFLQGVQLAMPFNAVASVMYASEGGEPALPSFQTMQLNVNQENLP